MVKAKHSKKETLSKKIFPTWLIEHRCLMLLIFLTAFSLLLLINHGGASDIKRAPIWALRAIAFLGLLFFYLLEYTDSTSKSLPIPGSHHTIFKWASLYLIIFLVINILSTAIRQPAISESLNYLMILAVISLVSFYTNSRAKINYALYVLSSFGLLVAIYGLILYFQDGASKPLDSFFNWHNPTGGYLASILTIFLALLLTEPLGKNKGRLGWLGLIILTPALVFTLSRGAWIASFLALALLIVLIGIKKAYHRTSTIIVVFAFIFLIIFSSLYGKNSLFEPVYHRIVSFTATKDFSIVGRENFYRSTLEIFNDHMGTGIGLGGFEYVYPQYQDDPRFYAKNPHSFYLKLLCEGGIFGIILILVGLWCYFHLLWKFILNRNQSINGVSAGLIAALTAGLLHLAIDFDDVFPFIPLNLGIIWVIAMNLHNTDLKPENALKNAEHTIKSRVISICTTLILVIFVFILTVHCARVYYSEVFLGIGKQYAIQGDWVKANNHFESAIHYYPGNVDAIAEHTQVLLAIYLQAKNSGNVNHNDIDNLLDKARMSSSKLKSIAPYRAKSYYLSGLSLQQIDDPKHLRQAIDEFETAIKLDPINSPQFYLDMAKAYWRLGLKSKSIDTINNFEKIYPYEYVEDYARIRMEWTDLLPTIYQQILLHKALIRKNSDDNIQTVNFLKKVLELEEVRKRIFEDAPYEVRKLKLGDKFVPHDTLVEDIQRLLDELSERDS